jgi:medium-chain acyl-[acyl-carrier-protein] hydrolase
MAREPVWVEETRVRTFETDFKGKWRPSGLVQNLAEAASRHASNLGFDYAGMAARDMVWVLSRLKIQFFELPDFAQPVWIKTWPKGIQQKLFFMRDFDLRDAVGKPLAAASFAWLLINPRIRRILQPQALGESIPDNNGMSALDEPLEKITLPGGLKELFQVDARYSTIDLLGHMNASRYVDWICDCFTQEDYAGNSLRWLQLNFINETRPGERLSIAAAPHPDDCALWFVQGVNLNSGAKAFEASLGWQKTMTQRS